MTLAIAAPLLLGAFAARAQAPPAEGPNEPSPPAATITDEIVVAERAPTDPAAAAAAVTVLTRDEIARLPAATLAELLSFVPGLVMLGGEPWGMAAMPAARGFFGGGEAEYLQLRVDGVPLSDVESGLADWGRLGAEEIERIEVLRGPAAALYGDTALAGVVRVTTRAVGADAASTGAGFAHVAGGSFGT
ncbi:MAG TPA: Plug domain-containing protein, partial [Thermoanaerobaculia bacterium]|nr:Plug domain-containing protein [Thermoanaerobaculia bacterium]